METSGVSNVTLARKSAEAANDLPGGLGTARLVLPSHRLSPGVQAAFTLQATNFLGETSSSTVAITKLDIPAPSVR